MPTALERLIGQHPAALRSVRWAGGDGRSASADVGHLELETKQGLVTLIDHRNGRAYSHPPAPPDATGERSATDLTERVPIAFDQRPIIEAILRVEEDAESAWCFELSNGSSFVFDLRTAKVKQRLNR